ncbi:hypothetical protein DYB28_004857 [Aphanomyces astaci]|uniref:Uncharacterized protein n=2 Tax=Aphanomyces astaci TaxID=112090 RepID=A0A3L6V070_APHAT|nr:hypothetical protein DYB34_011645 [Aphanomyces astaci]RLO02241.1 hypothetical protein DYB28_004857 [Aphanomyces astaci]
MPRVPTGRELTDVQRLAMYHRLLQLKTNRRVSQGQMKLLMHEFMVSQQTISRTWTHGRDFATSTGCAKVSSRKKGRCGAPPKYATTDVRTIITSTPSVLSVHIQVNVVVDRRSEDVAVEATSGQEVESQDESTETLVVTSTS